MALYTASGYTDRSNYLAGTLVADLRTGPSDNPRLLELHLSTDLNRFNDTFSWGFGLNSSLGVALASGVNFLPHDPAEAAAPGNIDVGFNWTTLPGAPANYQRRAINPSGAATAVASIIFRWPKGLRLLANSSYGLWIVASNGNVSSPFYFYWINWVIDA